MSRASLMAGFEVTLHGRIWVTPEAQGAIIRLREGTRSDLTVKLRLPDGRRLVSSSAKNDDFKCEIDLTGKRPNLSYSMTSRFAGEQLPQTGSQATGLLGPAQMQLITDAQVSVDWTHVKRIAEIRSTVWRTQSQPHLGKLALELWEWPGGAILELSTKVSPGSGPSAFTELQRLVKKKRLVPNTQQRHPATTQDCYRSRSHRGCRTALNSTRNYRRTPDSKRDPNALDGQVEGGALARYGDQNPTARGCALVGGQFVQGWAQQANSHGGSSQSWLAKKSSRVKRLNIVYLLPRTIRSKSEFPHIP